MIAIIVIHITFMVFVINNIFKVFYEGQGHSIMGGQCEELYPLN